jgi:hypothetical protein
MHIKMLGTKNRPVEIFVEHFVLAEIVADLCPRRGYKKQNKESGRLQNGKMVFVRHVDFSLPWRNFNFVS